MLHITYIIHYSLFDVYASIFNKLHKLYRSNIEALCFRLPPKPYFLLSFPISIDIIVYQPDLARH